MDNPIIVALDRVDQLEELRPLVNNLAPHVAMFKVGLELITRFGAPRMVHFVHGLGGQVFLDGKFDDTPDTVGQAVKAAAELDVEMFTVHASCGAESLKAAASAKGKSKMLVVTVLTSLDTEALLQIGHFGCLSVTGLDVHMTTGRYRDLDKRYIPYVVNTMAHVAADCGADGVVCSPLELPVLNKSLSARIKKLLKVTPGIRPSWADGDDDQKRVMKPGEAMQAGANYLVIGRPITCAPDRSPDEAAQDILREIENAMQSVSAE